MIGSAATHNFISKDLVDELQIPTEKTHSYSVNYGTSGDDYNGEEVCINVVIKAQGVEITQRFFPTNVANADEWLRCIAPSEMCEAGPTRFIILNWLGKNVTFHSDPSLNIEMDVGLMMLQLDGDDNEACNKK